MRIKFWSENLKGRESLQDIRIDRIIILKLIITKLFGSL
jgi:hypothetical protein